MLVGFFAWLAEFNPDFNVFGYLTLRAILGALTALGLSLLLGPAFIRRLERRQVGQPIRELGPESHFSKAGTPTMGGALILFTLVLATLLWSDLSNRYVWVVLLVTLAFGVIGWIDDYRKLVLKNSDGLPARAKMFWQSVIGLGVALFLYLTAVTPAETTLIVPFFKDVAVSLGWVYVILVYFVIVGSSNAVNLTDGLDGLASGIAAIIAMTLAFIAWQTNHVLGVAVGIPLVGVNHLEGHIGSVFLEPERYPGAGHAGRQAHPPGRIGRC